MKIGFKELRCINKHGKEIVILAKDEAIELLGTLKQKAADLDSAIKDIGGIENFFKLMCSIEEEVIEFLTLDSIVSWSKENRPTSADKAAILLLDSNVLSDECKIENCKYCCLACFLDEDDEVIESKVKYFYATYMEKRLTETFGDKDMIILK